MTKRKRNRDREVKCNCNAYKFPHRFGGGACTGFQMVEEFWYDNFGSNECAECPNLDESKDGIKTCDIVQGLEHPRECPIVQEFCRFHGVKI